VNTVALFGGLKLRLIAGNLRGDVGRQIGFAFMLLAAAGLAALGFFLMSLLRLAPADIALSLVTVVYAALLVSWVVVPLLAFGLDDTLDPARLSLFPLRTHELAVGMFTASATGVWPAATLIVTAGAVAGLAGSVGGVLIGLVAVVLQFAFCLVTSRLVTTALSSALRSRRGRDALAVSAIFVVLLFQLPNLLMNRGFGDPTGMLHGMAGALRWTPPGLAAHAIADGGLLALAEVAILAVAVAAVAWLWMKALGRALVSTDSSTQAASVRRGSGLADRLLPDGPLAAVVTKELKCIRRDPRYRVVWFAAVMVVVVVAFSTRAETFAGPWMTIGVTTFAAMMIAVQLGNAYGFDGSSVWMNVVAFGSQRDVGVDLAGRHLANTLVAVPVLALTAVAAALFTGHPEAAVWAFLASLGVLGVGLGVGSVTSVILPYTVPQRMNAFTGAAPGQGGQAFACAMLAFAGIAVLCAPFVVIVAFGGLWTLALAPLYGLLAEVLGRGLAAKIGFARMPELLGAVSRPS
jgi:ABC-2 type transport system permease protein